VPQPAPPGKVDVAPGAGWPTAPTKTLTEKLGRDKSSCPVVEATVSQCVEGLGVAGCSRLATSRQKSSETSRLSVAEGMARRMPSWSLRWRRLRAPAAVSRGRGSRCFVAVPLPAVGSLVQIGKDVIEADGAIRSLRADAALLDAAANSEHLALRPQERALAALFSADARETAAAWQGWVSGGPTARAIKTSDQRDPPAREDSSWLGLVGSAVSTAAETVQTVGATSVGTLGVAATAASKDLVGMRRSPKNWRGNSLRWRGWARCSAPTLLPAPAAGRNSKRRWFPVQKPPASSKFTSWLRCCHRGNLRDCCRGRSAMSPWRGTQRGRASASGRGELKPQTAIYNDMNSQLDYCHCCLLKSERCMRGAGS
jgi:hypothetical protein